MVATRRSVAAAVSPGGGGSDCGGSGGKKGSRGRSKRPAASTSPPPVASLTERGKRRRGRRRMRRPSPRRRRPRRRRRRRRRRRGSGSAAVNVTGKPLLKQARRPRAILLSQCPQTPDIVIHGNELSIGRGDNCLDDQAVSRNLCMLRHLEQGGPCELEVTGQNGWVVVNGTDITRDAKVPRRRGDEVVFGLSGKHAYIFLSDFRCPNPSVTLPLSSWQTSKDGWRQEILNPKDIDVTLDNFPYYLSEHTKEILLSSAFVHMDKKFSKSFPKISSLNQRILLSGPSGSEIYQEMLIMALAKEFDARLLILDSLALCSTSSTCEDSIKDARLDDATSISGPGVAGTSN